MTSLPPANKIPRVDELVNSESAFKAKKYFYHPFDFEEIVVNPASVPHELGGGGLLRRNG